MREAKHTLDICARTGHEARRAYLNGLGFSIASWDELEEGHRTVWTASRNGLSRKWQMAFLPISFGEPMFITNGALCHLPGRAPLFQNRSP